MTTLTQAVRSSATTGEKPARAKRVKLETRRALPAFYWMVWPAVIAFAAFHTVPVLVGIFFSFTNYAGYGEWNFVGLSNYVNLFKDDRVLAAYGFSFLFAIVATILTNVISLAIALGLNAKIKAPQLLARRLLRAVRARDPGHRLRVPVPLLELAAEDPRRASRSSPTTSSPTPTGRGRRSWRSRSGRPARSRSSSTCRACRRSPPSCTRRHRSTGRSPGGSSPSITFPLISAFFTINVVLSLKGFLQVFDHDRRPDERRPRHRRPSRSRC